MPSAPEGVENALQLSMRLHLTAIENYQTQSAHFERWGYPKLAAAKQEEADEEREHLGKILARLEYFDIEPQCDHDRPAWPRHDFEGILAANLELETAAAKAERANVLACRAVGDEQSALVFASLLEGSEASIAEIEAEMKVIEQIGLDNFLANKV